MEHTPQSSFLRYHPADPLLIALCDEVCGAPITENLSALDPIPAGHKVAVEWIASGQPVRKFGQVIGIASKDILPGEHIHTHNLAFSTSKDAGEPVAPSVSTAKKNEEISFDGIVRSCGSVATRNYIGILPTVNCAAHVARAIAQPFCQPGVLAEWPKVDGVVAFCHQSGCGIATDGLSHRLLQDTLRGYLRHPNFAAVVVVGLGCEVNQTDSLLAETGLRSNTHLRTVSIQQVGGTRQAIEQGRAEIEKLLPLANRVERESVPARFLKLGLQCGGSDGFSALSANPALGVAADLLVQQGATVVLSETPELYGAEHLLLNRARNQGVADKLREKIHWWETYAEKLGESLNNNPSHGNKLGGVTTIVEKSLGAVAKAGSSALCDVFDYAQTVESPGLVFMDSPGFDPVSATGQIAAGCNVICFTTGRGSCYGAKPVPSLKLASHSGLYRRMPEDIDVNCGEVLDGNCSIEEMGQIIFSNIVKAAGGQPTSSELLDYGDLEFAPWQPGGIY